MTDVAVVKREFERLRATTEKLFDEQWRDPELPAMEYRSSARLAAFLRAQSFEVDFNVGGLPTAFVACRKLGAGPVVAILAEYDALPGLAAEAKSTHVQGAAEAGHGCGHNHIGPANAAAAIVAAEAAMHLGLAGEIRVIGCPAEEILWGKIALLHSGVFDDINVVLTSHGDYQTGAVSRPCQAVVSGEFVFSGRAGHGGFSSRENALLAAEAFVSAVESNLAISHPDIGLRHVLRRAGVMPGITPDEARVWYTCRNVDFEKTQQAYAAICELAEATAHTRSIRHRQQFISETRGYLANDALGQLLFASMQEVGPPQWSAKDIRFMEELSVGCAPEEEMQLDRAVGYFDQGEDYYGQDDGDLSWRVPLGRVNWAYPTQVPIHHWAWTALSGHEASYAGPHCATQTLALSVLRLLADPALVAASKLELDMRTQNIALPLPRIGAEKTLRACPQSFWNATWVE